MTYWHLDHKTTAHELTKLQAMNLTRNCFRVSWLFFFVPSLPPPPPLLFLSLKYCYRSISDFMSFFSPCLSVSPLRLLLSFHFQLSEWKSRNGWLAPRSWRFYIIECFGKARATIQLIKQQVIHTRITWSSFQSRNDYANNCPTLAGLEINRNEARMNEFFCFE